MEPQKPYIERGRIALEAAADRRADSYSSFVDVSQAGDADFLLGSIHVRSKSWHSDLYASENWALMGHYFNVGFAMNFLTVPVTGFLVGTNGATPSGLNAFR